MASTELRRTAAQELFVLIVVLFGLASLGWPVERSLPRQAEHEDHGTFLASWAAHQQRCSLLELEVTEIDDDYGSLGLGSSGRRLWALLGDLRSESQRFMVSRAEVLSRAPKTSPPL
jgi:hypothetical protein